MKIRRPVSGVRRDQRNYLAPVRLVLEPLEARRLLAGIHLSVYVDLDDSRSFDPVSDQPAPERLVYVDLNVNGRHDTDEPIAITDRNGSAFFADLEPGDYSFGIIDSSSPQPPTEAPANQQQAEETSAPLRMHLELNQPSEMVSSLSAANYTLAEDAKHGAQLGPITIVGAGQDLNFEIVTSDPRFEIYDGNLYFISGQLDYETEPTIHFNVTATDYYSDLTVSRSFTVSILDVNERPDGLQLVGGKVPENDPGAIVGNLLISDVDAGAEYAFYLFDPRFTLVGTTLKLAPGVALDYETEPMVQLHIAATDGTHEIFTVLAISVLDRDEETIPNSSLQLDGQGLQEFVPGATVGLVSVVHPRDSNYKFSVSDPRFEIVGGVLKLRDDQRVSLRVDDPLSLTITALGNAGDQASATFPINISANQSPYHNLSVPEDVNGDGYVSPIDVLIIVNSLNLRGSYTVPSGGTPGGEPPAEMPDVNDDGVISPVDALLIINHINRHLDKVQREPVALPATLPDADEPELAAPDYGSSGVALESESERRRRENLSIDAELEDLLDQLAQSHSSAS